MLATLCYGQRDGLGVEITGWTVCIGLSALENLIWIALRMLIDRAEDVAAMPCDLPTLAELREHIGVHESKTGSCLATLCPA